MPIIIIIIYFTIYLFMGIEPNTLNLIHQWGVWPSHIDHLAFPLCKHGFQHQLGGMVCMGGPHSPFLYWFQCTQFKVLDIVLCLMY